MRRWKEIWKQSGEEVNSIILRAKAEANRERIKTASERRWTTKAALPGMKPILGSTILGSFESRVIFWQWTLNLIQYIVAIQVMMHLLHIERSWWSMVAWIAISPFLVFTVKYHENILIVIRNPNARKMMWPYLLGAQMLYLELSHLGIIDHHEPWMTEGYIALTLYGCLMIRKIHFLIWRAKADRYDAIARAKVSKPILLTGPVVKEAPIPKSSRCA